MKHLFSEFTDLACSLWDLRRISKCCFHCLMTSKDVKRCSEEAEIGFLYSVTRCLFHLCSNPHLRSWTLRCHRKNEVLDTSGRNEFSRWDCWTLPQRKGEQTQSRVPAPPQGEEPVEVVQTSGPGEVFWTWQTGKRSWSRPQTCWRVCSLSCPGNVLMSSWKS